MECAKEVQTPLATTGSLRLWELYNHSCIFFPVQLRIGCLTECPPFTGALLLGPSIHISR